MNDIFCEKSLQLGTQKSKKNFKWSQGILPKRVLHEHQIKIIITIMVHQ